MSVASVVDSQTVPARQLSSLLTQETMARDWASSCKRGSGTGTTVVRLVRRRGWGTSRASPGTVCEHEAGRFELKRAMVRILSQLPLFQDEEPADELIFIGVRAAGDELRQEAKAGHSQESVDP